MARDFFIAQTGTTQYVAITDPATGNWWNGTAFEAFLAANYATYKVAATEYGMTGRFFYTIPPTLAPGVYSVAAKTQAGGTPVQGDVNGAAGEVEWDGANVTAVSSRMAAASYTAPDNATISAIAGYVDTEVAAIKAKTDLLPAQPAAVGSAMTLVNGSITEATITTPAETAGRPANILGMMRRAYEWLTNERRRDRATGNLTLYGGTGNVLETQVQSTVGTLDKQTGGV